MPSAKVAAWPALCGTGCRLSAGTVRMSETPSTSRPSVILLTSVTMMALRSEASVPGMPSFTARSMIGMTVPRRLITPSTS
ncbi:hypothetical protein D3C87_2025210 [compost metagenome]